MVTSKNMSREVVKKAKTLSLCLKRGKREPETYRPVGLT